MSNELGAGNAARARLAVYVAAAIAASEGVVIGAITVLVRNVWGKLYSDEEEVIVYVARILPLLALSDFLDGFQCVLSGAARGCGWQTLCAVINLGAYYVVAIPCAVLLAFVFHLGGMVGICIKTVYKQENQASFSLKLKIVVAGPLDGDHMRAFSSSCGFDRDKYMH